LESLSAAIPEWTPRVATMSAQMTSAQVRRGSLVGFEGWIGFIVISLLYVGSSMVET